jgi:hypothetical protein
MHLGPVLVEWYYENGVEGDENFYRSPMMPNLVVDTPLI